MKSGKILDGLVHLKTPKAFQIFYDRNWTIVLIEIKKAYQLIIFTITCKIHYTNVVTQHFQVRKSYFLIETRLKGL